MISTTALSPFLAIFLMAAQGHLPDPAPDARREFAAGVMVSTPLAIPASPRPPVPSDATAKTSRSTQLEH